MFPERARERLLPEEVVVVLRRVPEGSVTGVEVVPRLVEVDPNARVLAHRRAVELRRVVRALLGSHRRLQRDPFGEDQGVVVLTVGLQLSP